MSRILWKYKVFGVLLISFLTGGCSAVGLSRSVLVTANENVCKKSVEVHLVGVNRFEKQQWELVSMTEYWQPKNQLRESAKDYTHAIHFGKEPCERILGKKDPILRVWKKRKAEYLFVLVDLPGIHQDLPGNTDARRLQLPALDSECWGLQTKIQLVIKNSNIISLTIPKPECE